MSIKAESRRPKFTGAFESLRKHAVQEIIDNRGLLKRSHLGGQPLTRAEGETVSRLKRLSENAMLGKQYWDLLDLSDEERKRLGF